MQTRLLLTFLLIISLPSLGDDDTYPKVDEIWKLITKSNKASISTSEREPLHGLRRLTR